MNFSEADELLQLAAARQQVSKNGMLPILFTCSISIKFLILMMKCVTDVCICGPYYIFIIDENLFLLSIRSITMVCLVSQFQFCH